MGSSANDPVNKLITVLSHEVSLAVTLFTIFAALGGSITIAQMGAMKSCEAKGPAKCSMAAIRAW